MKTWMKSLNSPVSHAVDIERCNFRTVCGITLVGDINKIKTPDENQPRCKKCLKYP